MMADFDSGVKVCSKCRRELSIGEFSCDKSTYDGLRCRCKECHNAGQRDYREKNQEIINDLKINGCSMCGYCKNSAALTFHHVEPEEKKFEINAITITKPDLIEEFHKCMLLCRNCHAEIENPKFGDETK